MGDSMVAGLRAPTAAQSACVFQIRSWMAWAPDRVAEEDWLRWTGVTGSSIPFPSPATSPLPSLLRRRVTALGQAALRCAWHMPVLSDALLIAASRHGEYSRTLAILEGLVAGEPVSPADFTLSVHHALIGLLSIAAENQDGHTAVAAGADSFAFGLVEAAACLAERPGRPVILVYYDEALPQPFDRFNIREQQPLALALALVSSGERESFSVAGRPNPGGKDDDESQAEAFIRFLLAGDADRSLASERYIWEWRRHVAAA